MIVAVTGHTEKRIYQYKDWIFKETEIQLMSLKPELLISGLANGFDSWAVEIALKLNIPFIAYLPFLEQNFNINLANPLCKLARDIKFLLPEDNLKNKYQIRDCRVVDCCDLLLGCWTGEKSGTGDTIEYGRKCKKEIIFLDPRLKIIQYESS